MGKCLAKQTTPTVTVKDVAPDPISTPHRPPQPPRGTPKSGPNSNRNGVLNQRSSAGQASAYTNNALHERGENLSKVAQQTRKLSINAPQYESQSFELMEKYQKKKWYQW
uniref:Uncharacterized protein n=1 Tax=Plectus sambesii TaxID=2011161 RepID=A0A914WJ15_9BILA